LLNKDGFRDSYRSPRVVGNIEIKVLGIGYDGKTTGGYRAARADILEKSTW